MSEPRLLPKLPTPPTLPQSLLTTMGEYGMARTDGVNELEVQARWLALIEGIKLYAVAYGMTVARAKPEHGEG